MEPSDAPPIDADGLRKALQQDELRVTFNPRSRSRAVSSAASKRSFAGNIQPWE